MLSHTYYTKLKSKSFIITTVLIALGIFIMANLDTIVSVFQKEESAQTRLVVLDESGIDIFPHLVEQMDSFSQGVNLETSSEGIDTLKEMVEVGTVNGVLHITAGGDQFPAAVYYSRTHSMNTLVFDLQTILQQVKSTMAAEKLDLTSEQLATLHAPVSFTQEAIMESAKSQEEMNQARGIVYVLLFFIYFSVIMFANMTAMEVAVEKSSRVMEILISSVSPVKQMFAKIIGIGMAGLTQLIIFLFVGFMSIREKELVGGFFDVFGFSALSISTIVFATVFFLLGYFLYATLAALLGSLVSRIEDVQQMILPMTFLVMIGFFIAMFGLGNPDSTFITISSYIPFFTPMVMFLRVGMLNISMIEPILGIVVLLVSIIVLAVFGAKVYSGGVLMYGKSSSFKDIKKAIEITQKQ